MMLEQGPMNNGVPEIHSRMAEALPWGPREVWAHAGARAVGECRAYVEANLGARSEALWAKAKAVASEICGDFFIDTMNPDFDAGLTDSIDQVLVAVLFGYMDERRQHLKTRRLVLSEAEDEIRGTALEGAQEGTVA